LNGKIKVKIDRVMNINLYVYQMPNSFNEEKYGTKGIFENNKLDSKVRKGTYEVPTDWSLWIVYNPSYISGTF
jgi:hypothetical protein